MSSSQDWSDVNRRPMKWIYGTACVLFLSGMVFSVWMSLSSSATWSSRSKVGLFLLEALFIFTVLTLPGMLLAFRHPWGAFLRLQVEQQRFAHPRLYGMAVVWASLVLISDRARVRLFIPGSFASILDWLPVMPLVAIAPFLALYLFDRRR
jgi:hypothetical protein